MDLSGIRNLGSQLAGKASEVGAAGAGQVTEWTDKAVRGAVDTMVHVLEVAAEEAAKREFRGSAVTLSATVNVGIVQLGMSIEFSKAELTGGWTAPAIRGSVGPAADPPPPGDLG